MPDVFVSYAHEDTTTARILAASLKRLGWSVWIDDRLEVGRPFTEEIRRALETAGGVIVLWSRPSTKSEWVLKEAGIGKARSVLVPVMLEQVELPQEFAELHAAHLSNWDGAVSDRGFGRLCLALADRIGTRSDEAKRMAERARRELEELRRGASRWSDLAAPIRVREEIPWPYWMVRYIVADTREALEDLIWSVGGSTPYGGVSWEEAEAVYALIEKFQGPGRASEESYAAVERFLPGRAEASRALEAFRIFDRVTSNSEKYTDRDLRIGGVDAVEAVDEPLSSYFDFLQAQLRYQLGDLHEAYHLSQRAIDSLWRHYEADSVYHHRLIQALTNTCSFSVLNGDFSEARRCAALLKKLGAEDMLRGLREPLLSPPEFPQDYAEQIRVAQDHLEQHRHYFALEWLLQAERLAVAEKRESELPGLLGDLAIAYRRLGNEQKAISTGRRAIEVSQRAGDMLSVSRWCQNLAGILAGGGDVEAALPYARTGLYAAAHLADPQQLELAAGLLISLLGARSETRKAAVDVLRAATVLIKAAPAGVDRDKALSIIHRSLDEMDV